MIMLKQIMDLRVNSNIKIHIKNAVTVKRIQYTTALLLITNINKALKEKTDDRVIAAR